MTLDIRKFSERLRKINDDYLHQQINRGEYLAQRKIIFDDIEQALSTGISVPYEQLNDESRGGGEENLVGKITAFFRD